MTQERWLPVVGYEGLYEVSDHGRVRSLLAKRRGSVEYVRAEPRVLSPGVKPAGYKIVRLTARGGGVSTLHVHRLVLLAFVGEPPEGKPDAAHGDGDPGNCALQNLRWSSKVENERDKIGHGTRLLGEALTWAKLTADQVRVIRSSPRTMETYRIRAAEFGVAWQTVSKAATGATWKHV